jgi:hypothetical protein
MCSHVFVETETPTAVFFSSGGSRGGFGEMTIFKQRFKRWNFFFVNGMYYNMAYIFGSWKLGWWEIGAKIFVFQEVCTLKLLQRLLFTKISGLRNSPLSSHAIYSTNIVLRPTGILWHPPRFDYYHVSDQCHHFQRDTSPAQERTTRLEIAIRVLLTV